MARRYGRTVAMSKLIADHTHFSTAQITHARRYILGFVAMNGKAAQLRLHFVYCTIPLGHIAIPKVDYRFYFVSLTSKSDKV